MQNSNPRINNFVAEDHSPVMVGPGAASAVRIDKERKRNLKNAGSNIHRVSSNHRLGTGLLEAESISLDNHKTTGGNHTMAMIGA